MNSKQELPVSIPKPCTASWEAMTPGPEGRFCSSCEKVVIDFSQMDQAAIIAWFSAHTASATCGRFENSQINPVAQTRTAVFLKNCQSSLKLHVSFAPARWLSLFLIGGIMSLFGCATSGETHTAGETLVKGDTIHGARCKPTDTIGQVTTPLRDTAKSSK